MKNSIKYILALLIFPSLLFSQKGELPPENGTFNPDTVFIFYSPRPLIKTLITPDGSTQGLGFDLVFSNSGFGIGFFWQKFFNPNLLLYTNLLISGARNTDEFEVRYYNYNTGRIEEFVPNKVNRLYMFPFTIGLQHYIFADELVESFKPFLNLGVGPTFIIATPYQREFFNAFGYAQFYTRFGASVGAGAELSSVASTVLSLNIKYYYIPFGGNGLESIRNSPIYNFGGVFLSLSLGSRF